MSNIQSYNALIDRFKAFASGHFILKTFSHGQIDTADLEKFTEYPFMHVVPSNVTYAKGTKTFSFQIVLADLPRDKDDKVEFQKEVLSDLQRIAEDLVAEITNHRVLFGDLITVQNVTLEPFLEEFHNTLTGWTVSLDLLVPYYWDACSIPAEWNDFFESGSGGTGSILTFVDSITRDENGNVSLVNDEATPAPNYYYGTNDEGVRGWYLLTDEVGLTCATIGTCQTIIDIEAAIDDLQTEVALKADITSISAVGFSNDYNDLDNKPTIPTTTSELTNDGADGVNPFITAQDLPDTSGFVPYTGATNDVNLGTHDLTATQGTFATNGNPDTLTVNHTSGSGKALTITKGGNGEGIYVNKTSGSGNAVTVVGDLEATNLKRTGGTSSQFLKADGSVDSSSYYVLPSLTSGSVLFSNGTTIAQDNANLFWDDTNNRLGIGTASPAARLDSSGTIRTTAATTPSSGAGVEISYSTLGNIFSFDRTAGQYKSLNLNDKMLVAANGNVLINTTTDAGFRLDVNGITMLRGIVYGVGTTGTAIPLLTTSGTGTAVIGGNAFTPLRIQGSNLQLLVGSTQVGLFNATTGNLTLQNGGTFTDAGYRLDVNGSVRTTGSISAASAIARGTYLNQTLVATANNDVLVGLDIAPTFTTGAFTGVTGVGLRCGNIQTLVNTTINLGYNSTGATNEFVLLGGTRAYVGWDGTIGGAVIGTVTTRNLSIGTGSQGSMTTMMRMFGATGNFTLQNGGTFTDAGYRLDVQGTSRFTGTALFGSAITVGGAVAINNSLAVGTNQVLQASAQLEVVSTTRGFLPPRMTTTQKNAIASPAAGLVVYDTTLGKLCVRTASAWETITSA